MSDEEKELIEETNKSAEDEHEEHDVSLFIKIFAWLVFYTLIEVGAILQEFSFWTTMFILFSIANLDKPPKISYSDVCDITH